MLLKSEVGSFPPPEYPPGIDLAAEERKARRRLYPITVIYSAYFWGVLARALRSPAPRVAIGYLVLGIITWTGIEYWVHRSLLHGVFPNRPGFVAQSLHKLFDPMHADHHRRPWDGMHINGHLDTLFVAVPVAPVTLLARSYTWPVFFATILQSFVVEEWLHHSIHFFNFKSRYFRYLRRRHFYHHSPRGTGFAFAMTSGLWDLLAGTRISEQDRLKLAAEPDSLRCPPKARRPAARRMAEGDAATLR